MYCSSPNDDCYFKPNKCIRQKLQDRFDNECSNMCSSTPDKQHCSSERSVLNSLSNLSETSERVFRSGAEKLSKTINNIRITWGTFSQKFKISTKRRQRLEEGPMTPACITPQTKIREVLGRTPTKLYSPFGIDSPIKRADNLDKENVPPRNDWLPKKKSGKKLKSIRVSMSKLNNMMSLNRYGDITPDHKRSALHPLKLRS